VRLAVAALAAALAVTALPAAGGAAAAKPRPGGTVVLPYGEPTCFNPLVQACHLGVVQYPVHITSLVLAGAFDVGADFTWRPRLVSHVTVRTQPFTLTFHIRPRARWSDGTPVTARDFVFTHQSIVRHLPPDRHGVHADVLRVVPRGPKTVHVLMRRQVAHWRYLFGTILPRHVLAGEDLGAVWRNGIDDPKTGRPIGSGPFLFSRWERGRQITLARNPGYWDRRAHIDRLVFRFTSGGRSGQIPHLLAGNVDFVDAPSSADELATLRRSPRIRVAVGPAPGYDHLLIRLGPGGHPALRNRAVRRALAHAIDREALARALFPGFGRHLQQPHDSVMFLATSPHYRPNWSAYRHRAGAGPREARRLLESAGCRRGPDGIYACGGNKLSFNLATTTNIAFRRQTVSIIQAQLGRIGIEIVPSFYSDPALFNRLLPTGNFDLLLFAWTLGPEPGGGDRIVWGCDGERNHMGYCNRQVTRNLEQAQRILDRRRQARVVNLADAQIARDVPALPLYQWRFMYAYKRELRGVAWRPYRLNAEGWWLDR
jgi:peptide/nickel transport system substrate-binding protein